MWSTKRLLLPLRAAQAVCTLVVLGTSAYVTNWWLHYWHDTPPTSITFLLFSAVWTLLTLVYVVAAPARFPKAAPRLVLLGADGLAMTFWFAGFVALAVFLSSRICFGKVCNLAKTSMGFAVVQWLLFGATTALAGVSVFRGRAPKVAASPKMVVEPPMSPNPDPKARPSVTADDGTFERVNMA